MACDWNMGAVLAKYPTGGLTRREKKKNKSKNGKKNLLEDLPGGKRRKLRVKMAKKPTGGLIKGEKKKRVGKNGKKRYQGGFGGGRDFSKIGMPLLYNIYEYLHMYANI